MRWASGGERIKLSAEFEEQLSEFTTSEDEKEEERRGLFHAPTFFLLSTSRVRDPLAKWCPPEKYEG